MVDSFDSSGNDFVVVKGGVEKFSTLKKKFNRVPLAEIDLTAYAITFPNFLNLTYFYEYNTFNSGPPLNSTGEACSSFGVIPAQEWGPSASPYNFTSPHILADIDVGAAPTGTDYVDVQVNLTRTTTPLMLGNNYVWPISFIQGQWLNLTDGSLVVEKFAGYARMFWFEVVAGRILLRRKQSIGSANIVTHLLDAKENVPGLNQLGPANAGGTGCANINSRNYTSVFTGDIKIIPCSTS